VGLINEDVNHTGDATLPRRVNGSVVLELIRRCGPVTRSDLARRLHLSLPTITRIANELLNASLIVGASSAESGGSRRPGLLEFNCRANLIISVYVGHKTVMALADLGGGTIELHTETSLAGEEVLQQLISTIHDLRQRADAGDSLAPCDHVGGRRLPEHCCREPDMRRRSGADRPQRRSRWLRRDVYPADSRTD